MDQVEKPRPKKPLVHITLPRPTGVGVRPRTLDPCPVLFPTPPRRFPAALLRNSTRDMVRDMPGSPGLTNHHLPWDQGYPRPKGEVSQGLGPLGDQQDSPPPPLSPWGSSLTVQPGLNSELPARVETPATSSKLACFPPPPSLGLQTPTWGLSLSPAALKRSHEHRENGTG